MNCLSPYKNVYIALEYIISMDYKTMTHDEIKKVEIKAIRDLLKILEKQREIDIESLINIRVDIDCLLY